MTSPIHPSPTRLPPSRQYGPEPKNSGVMGKLFSRLTDLLKDTAPQILGGGVLGGGADGGIYTDLIQEQMRQQQQMQLVSIISNTEKSKHETAMVPLRNLSVR